MRASDEIPGDRSDGRCFPLPRRTGWLALSTVSDWRWLLHREDTPWYPSVRLFRQARLGRWDAVFSRMAEELARLVEGKRPGRTVAVELSPGEAIDRWTIARLEGRRITDGRKRAHVATELAALERACRQGLPWSQEVETLGRELERVNEQLWDVEDGLRLCERAADFGGRFVELARSVYRLNDRRGELKRRISEWPGAAWLEQRQYGEEMPDAPSTGVVG